ncbi:MAG: tyrosine-type recombinase/integrase [Streptosporangiaceae bacterium]
MGCAHPRGLRHAGRSGAGDRAVPARASVDLRQGRAGSPGVPGAMGGPLRRGNFDKMSAWPHAVRSVGAERLHFHDLRHMRNTFAASSGAGLRDLMARMGHDSERAAMIYQHEARDADRPSRSRSTHTSGPSRVATRATTARPARSRPWANGTLMPGALTRCPWRSPSDRGCPRHPG